MLRQFASLRIKAGLTSLSEDEDEEGVPGHRAFYTSSELPSINKKHAFRRHRTERAQTLTSFPPPPSPEQQGDPPSGKSSLKSSLPNKPSKPASRKKLKRGLFHSISAWSMSSGAGSDSSQSSTSSSTSLSISPLWGDSPGDMPAHGAAVIAGLVRLKTVPFQEWNVADVSMWLDLICMGMYIPAFRRNEVTGQYLTQIDKHDLRSMGMKSIGHRKRFERRLKMLLDGDEGALDEPSLMERRGAKNSSSLWTMSINPPSNPHTPKVSSFSISAFSVGPSRKDRDQEVKRVYKKMPSNGDSISGTEDDVIIAPTGNDMPQKYSGTIDGLIETLSTTTIMENKQTDKPLEDPDSLSGTEGTTKRKTSAAPLPRQPFPKGSVLVMEDQWDSVSHDDQLEKKQNGVIAQRPQMSKNGISPRALKHVFPFTRTRSNSKSTTPHLSGESKAPNQGEDNPSRPSDVPSLRSLEPMLLALQGVETNHRSRRLSIPITPREKMGTQIILRLREEQRKIENQERKTEPTQPTLETRLSKDRDSDVSNSSSSNMNQPDLPQEGEADTKVETKCSKVKKAKKSKRSHKKSKKDLDDTLYDDMSSLPRALSESGSKSIKRTKKKRDSGLSSSKSAASTTDSVLSKRLSKSVPSEKKRKLRAKSLGRDDAKELKKKMSEAGIIESKGGRKKGSRRRSPEQVIKREEDDAKENSPVPRLKRRGTLDTLRHEHDHTMPSSLLAQTELRRTYDTLLSSRGSKRTEKEKKQKREQKRKEKDEKERSRKDKHRQRKPVVEDQERIDQEREVAKESAPIASVATATGTQQTSDSKSRRKKKHHKPGDLDSSPPKQKKKKKRSKAKSVIVQKSEEGNDQKVPSPVASEETTATIIRTRDKALDDMDRCWWSKISRKVIVKCILGDDISLFFVRPDVSLPQLRYLIRKTLGKPPGWKFVIKSRTNIQRRLVTIDRTVYLRGALRFHLSCPEPSHPLGGAAMRLYLSES